MKLLLCETSQLVNCHGFEIEVKGQTLSGFLLRDRGQIRAYQNRCPHTGIELNWLPDQFLDLEGRQILCATHGARFRLNDGHCISGPCVGQKLSPLAISVENGQIYLQHDEC